jgi:hypothetical protein
MRFPPCIVYYDSILSGGVSRLVDNEKTKSERPDRKQFLIHIEADLIRRVKILAIDRRVSASSLVQEAITEYLSRCDRHGTKR